MNLEYSNPFEQDFPEVIEDCLEDGSISLVSFHRQGSLLAAGTTDGRCLIFDFDTRGLVRELHGHVKPVTAISWSRDGRYLLSAGMDWRCIVWNLEEGRRHATVHFDGPVFHAQMHPSRSLVFLASPMGSAPQLIDVSRHSDAVERTLIELGSGNVDEDAVISDTSFVYACFDGRPEKSSSGNGRMYFGTDKGMVHVVDGVSHETLCSFRCANNVPIRQIAFSRDGKHLAVNATDRVIRLYAIGQDPAAEPRLVHKFQDLVNRIQWSRCLFSADGEYVIGGSAADHNVYIWDRHMGNLVKILEGPNEALEDVAWHPFRPLLASVSSFGLIYIWAKNYQENWSAFAPDFKELEENAEYEEREDEFDVVETNTTVKREIEVLEVDIETVDVVSTAVALTATSPGADGDTIDMDRPNADLVFLSTRLQDFEQDDHADELDDDMENTIRQQNTSDRHAQQATHTESNRSSGGASPRSTTNTSKSRKSSSASKKSSSSKKRKTTKSALSRSVTVVDADVAVVDVETPDVVVDDEDAMEVSVSVEDAAHV